MIKNLKGIVISFCAGLGIGVFGGKIYYDKKYQIKMREAEEKAAKEKAEVVVEEKIESAESIEVDEKNSKESSEINKNKEDLSAMAAALKKEQENHPRVDYSTPTPTEKKVNPDHNPSIEEDFEYEPEDFGERLDEDYEVVELKYTGDGYLVHENGDTFEVIEEPQRKIGKKAMSMLKLDEGDDIMYVRNKRIKVDFEIARIDDTLSEKMSADDDEDYED